MGTGRNRARISGRPSFINVGLVSGFRLEGEWDPVAVRNGKGAAGCERDGQVKHPTRIVELWHDNPLFAWSLRRC
jgi:hypothetical protein